MNSIKRQNSPRDACNPIQKLLNLNLTASMQRLLELVNTSGTMSEVCVCVSLGCQGTSGAIV